METNLFYGLLLIGLGAFSSGSFAIPFVKVAKWRWETYWMVFSFSAYIILPLVSSFLFCPGFLDIFSEMDSWTIWKVFLLGAVYGIGNLSFGLSLRYLGLSLGYALSLGLMLGIGTLIPPMIDGRLNAIMASEGGNLLFAGIGVAFIGIFLVAYAGYIKDKSRKTASANDNIQEYNFIKGILAALLVGVTGSALSLGIEQSQPIADFAIAKGSSPLFAINPVVLILLGGTMTTTLFWCGYQGYKSKSIKEYACIGNKSALSLNYVLCLIAGVLWFAQLFLYGMGKSHMGKFTFVAWGILMALTIVFATLWGVFKGEWRGVSRVNYIILITALIVLCVSSFMIGMSGSN